MTSRVCTALLLACLAGQMSGGTARAEGAVETLHTAWQGCLNRSFGLQAALTSKASAADSALRSCRDHENSYLAALAASPLVDGEDVARVRPALLERARGWLLGRRPSPTL